MLRPNQTVVKSFSKQIKKTRADIQFRGEFSYVALSSGLISSFELDAIRHHLRRGLKRTARVWSMIKAHKPLTKKSTAARMGKGKGNVKYWVAVVPRYCLLLQVSVGVNSAAALRKIDRLRPKLSLNLKRINRSVWWS